MKKKLNEICFRMSMLLIFCWDIVEAILPYGSFVILAVLFLLVTVKKQRIYFNRKLGLVIGIITIHAIINIVLKNDTLNLAIAQIGSLVLCYLTFSQVSSEISVLEFFRIYWKHAVVFSIIACAQEFICILRLYSLSKIPLLFFFTNYDYRVLGFAKVTSLCTEPSFLVYLLAPAMCLIIASLFGKEFLPKEFIMPVWNKLVIVCAYLFTFSGLGFLGIGIMFLVLWWRKGVSINKVVMPLICIVLCFGMYIYIPDINLRVNDTLSVLSSSKITDISANLSTYALVSNQKVALRTSRYSFGLGTGIGSYPLMYDKFSNMTWCGTHVILNREDANSLFLRIISELGLWGIALLSFFLIKCGKLKNKVYIGFSSAILSLVFLWIIRQGNYSHAGSILFYIYYYKIYRESNRLR